MLYCGRVRRPWLSNYEIVTVTYPKAKPKHLTATTSLQWNEHLLQSIEMVNFRFVLPIGKVRVFIFYLFIFAVCGLI